MFEKEAEEYAGNREVCDLLDAISEDLQNYDYGTVAHYNIDPLVEECFKDGAEFGYNNNKANEELKEKISVLLSCKNCPENKDGLICQKEYEGKCLAQKIQYIKELKEENAELKEKLKPENYLKLLAKEGYIKFTSDQLTKAKEIIEELYNIIPASMADYAKEPMEHARKFMTEE